MRLRNAVMLVSTLTPFCLAQDYQAAFSATVEEVRTFLAGETNAKLAYVNYRGSTKALHFIDFSEGTGEPTIHRIPAAVMPTSPNISPDGRWVVFASADGVNGEAGTLEHVRSSIYICRLQEGATPVLVAADSAYEPRFVQNATTLSVVYPTLAPNRAWEGPGKTMVARIDTTGGNPTVTSTEVLFEHGAYTGGLSYDGRYLCGGGGTVAMIDLQGTATQPNITLDPWSGQGCNASITSSRLNTDRMMYLDFGSAGVAVDTINDTLPWATWQVIFVSDINAGVVGHYPYPRNPAIAYSFIDENISPPSTTTGQETVSAIKWHHPEWSNHPYYAVATINVDRKYRYPSVHGGAWVHYEDQERVVLLDTRTRGTYLEVLRRADCCYLDSVGRGFFWPTLWVSTEGFIEIGVNRRFAPGLSGSGLAFTNGVVSSERALNAVHVFDLNGRIVQTVAVKPGQRQVRIGSLRNAAGAALVRATAGGETRSWRVAAVD